MKELKKFLNKSTDIIYNFLDKVANIIKDDNKTTLIKTIIKLCMLVLIYSICGLIAEGFTYIGSYIIYQVADTGRSLLSSIWNIAVSLTFFLFIIVSLFELTHIAEKDNKFFAIYTDKKKDKKTKKQIFLTVENVIKALGIIILIPLFVADIASLFILGIMVGYLRKGIYLISLFIILIGIIIFITTIILLIKKLLSKENKNLKKYLGSMIVSGIIIAGSCIGVIFETSSYKIDQNLTTDFNMSVLRYEYKMDTTKDYVFYNNGSDKNIELVIDEDMGSYIEVVVTHSTTSEVSSNIKALGNKMNIYYDQDLNIQTEDLENILNLGVACLKEKTIYNYTLLKYAKIEVRASSKYAEKIKFIDKKGKEYTPYEGNN